MHARQIGPLNLGAKPYVRQKSQIVFVGAGYRVLLAATDCEPKDTALPPRKSDYKNRTELVQGTLDMLILQTLQWGPQHGYGIVQVLHTRSGEVLQVETSLYPALHRLERQGWVRSQWKFTQSNQRRPLLPDHRCRQKTARIRSRSLATNGLRDCHRHANQIIGAADDETLAPPRKRCRRRDHYPYHHVHRRPHRSRRVF